MKALASLIMIVTVIAPEVHSNWPTVAANPERISWCSEEVRGELYCQWFRPIEPYIPPNVQIIAANDMVFVSTARGLYTFDAATGAQKWIYPTEVPLGHSPTVYNNVAYVGGLDHRLHAIQVTSGAKVWTFTAGAGFRTNPLVINDIVYAGCRDGYLYCIHAHSGNLIWKFKTDGPVNFSAAYKDGVVYFASDDSYAYAVNAVTGGLVWKSPKLPGTGFHSWWPVVYRDMIILAGSNSYRTSIRPGGGDQYSQLEKADVWPDYENIPRGTQLGPKGNEPGDWAAGYVTIDATRAMQYLEEKPWRRTYFVLNRATGNEISYDLDGDGKQEYAPILWAGTHSGNRYPPVVGIDGVIYHHCMTMSDPSIAGTSIAGWKPGTPFLNIADRGWGACDEPRAVSAGGKLLYQNLCCDRSFKSFDITVPNTKVYGESGSSDMGWGHFGYNLSELIPGYNKSYYFTVGEEYRPYRVFGGINGVYGDHGDQNPPIPYKNKVYIHRSNTILAFGPQEVSGAELPIASTVPTKQADVTLEVPQIQVLLEQEIEKMLDAGHLRPGYVPHGIVDYRNGRTFEGDYMVDYWHHPSDIHYYLIRALPQLSSPLQEKVKTYLQSEFSSYSPAEYATIGWAEGASREAFDLPPEVIGEMSGASKKENIYMPEGLGWKSAPHQFYGMWKYAQIFGGAKEIFDKAKSRLAPVLHDSVLVQRSYYHNSYIVGYIGYLELEKLAGYPESNIIRTELNRLLSLRASTFSKDTPYGPEYDLGRSKFKYRRVMNPCRNFIYMVPELAQFLRDNVRQRVQETVAEYHRIVPYWFVSKYEATYAEGATDILYQYHGLFQARAQILKQPFVELVKWLDVPGVAIGDLFYIDNLVSLLEANEPLPRITSPYSIIVPADSSFGRRVEYVNPLGGQGALTFNHNLGWAIAMGDSIWGKAPNTPGISGSVQVILTIDGTPHDTVDVKIMVVNPTGIKSSFTINRKVKMDINTVQCLGKRVLFDLTLPLSQSYKLCIYDLQGKRIWERKGIAKEAQRKWLEWEVRGQNSVWLAVLTQGNKTKQQKFIILK